MTTLHQKSTNAVLWSMLDVFMRQGLQFIVVMVMARILTPQDFGVVAMLAIFVGVAGIFIDSGFSSALIQRQDITHTDESTVFFFNLGTAALVALLLCAAAPWIAVFFKQPVLQYLTYAMALNLFIGALGSIHSTLLSKELNFKTTAKVGLVASLLSGGLAIILASQGFGVWSLAGQMLMASVITVVLLWIWHPWRPLWVFSAASLRSLFRFGGYLMAMSMAEVIHSSLYPILIGKFYSVQDVGFYDRAQRTQLLLGTLITSIINRVALPAFSASAHNKEKLARGFRKTQRLVMFVNIPMMLSVIVLAEPIVKLLFGDQWSSCVPILRVLGLVGMMLPLQIFNVNMLMAQGRSDLLFNLMLVKRTVAISLTVAASFHGIMAMAWAQVLASVFSLGVNAHYSKVFLNFGVFKQFQDLFPCLVAALLAGLGMWTLVLLTDLPAYLELPVALSIGGVLYLLVCRFLRAEAYFEVIGLVRNRAKLNGDDLAK